MPFPRLNLTNGRPPAMVEKTPFFRVALVQNVKDWRIWVVGIFPSVAILSHIFYTLEVFIIKSCEGPVSKRSEKALVRLVEPRI